MASVLYALNKSKSVMLTTTFGVIVKAICIVIFGLLKFGIYALILSEIVNIILVCIISYLEINFFLKKRSCRP